MHANGRVMPPGSLVAAYQSALRGHREGERPAGPVGDMLDCLNTAGWQPATATSYATRSGQEVSALRLSPAAIARLYCQEVNRLASGQGMTATVARINSVGFKVMLKLLPDDGVDNAAAKDLFRSLYKWKDLDCASLFDKCDAPPPPTSS